MFVAVLPPILKHYQKQQQQQRYHLRQQGFLPLTAITISSYNTSTNSSPLPSPSPQLNNITDNTLYNPLPTSTTLSAFPPPPPLLLLLLMLLMQLLLLPPPPLLHYYTITASQGKTSLSRILQPTRNSSKIFKIHPIILRKRRAYWIM